MLSLKGRSPNSVAATAAILLFSAAFLAPHSTAAQSVTLQPPSGQGFSIATSDLVSGANVAKYLIEGAPYSNEDTGAAIIFQRNAKGKWDQIITLKTATQAHADFGHSVSMSLNGKWAAVGAPNDGAPPPANPGDFSEGPGAVYLYKLQDGTWQKSTILRGTNVVGNAKFGESVFISPDSSTLFVGGPRNDNIGAVWVYDLTSGTPKQKAILKPNDSTNNPYFGRAISSSLIGDRVVIGGTQDNDGIGAVWVFERDSKGKWSQSGSKIVGTGGTAGLQSQGYSLSMKSNGNAFIVGAPYDNEYRGSAFVFERDASGKWKQLLQLKDESAAPYDNFGWAVAMGAGNGGTIAISAPYANNYTGKIFTYSKSSATSPYVAWQQPLANAQCTQLGTSLVLSASSGMLLAGAPDTNDANGNYTGATCYFSREVVNSNNTWKISGKPIIAK